ncbi:hypothetical protein ON010_g13500 [Phytophthora cinnamomi]|nr:hypothetical protein ON010_g13500 [Phytophthora cinnamomi]
MIEGKSLSFFQFHQSRPKSDPTSKPDRIIGWAHPELRQLLLYNGVSLFLDGTFRCVPTEFKQCMVLMVHDQASDLFVPVYFVLCTSKAQDMYLDTLELIHKDTAEKLNPCDIVCDFELPLINAVEKLFPNAEVIGCLFHFKQAVRGRKKTTYHNPEAEIRIAMQKVVLAVQTVIDPELVPRQGIRWVKRTIRDRCAAAGVTYTRSKWRRFWGYFRATWLDRYNVEAWNVFLLENSLVARTNNPLVRFNRELNQAFPSPHPNIATFVRVIRDISQNYVAKLTNVAQGRRRRGNRLNAKKRKNAQRAIQESIELREPVPFSEADACGDSESEEAIEESNDSSTDEFRDTGNDGNEGDHDDGEDVSSDEVIPDYSFEPSECGDEDEIQAANV